MHCIRISMHQCNALHQCIALHWISVSVAATDPNSFSSYYSLSLQVAAVILWNYQLSFCHCSDFDSDHLEGSLFIDLAIMTPAQFVLIAIHLKIAQFLTWSQIFTGRNFIIGLKYDFKPTTGLFTKSTHPSPIKDKEQIGKLLYCSILSTDNIVLGVQGQITGGTANLQCQVTWKPIWKWSTG